MSVSMEKLAVYVYPSRDVWLILEFKNSGMLSINSVKARATFSGSHKTRCIWKSISWEKECIFSCIYTVRLTRSLNRQTNTCTHLIFYLLNLLTYSMEQGPSWEASSFAAGQEIPRVLWNPKVPHRTHKRPPPVPILSQPIPVLIPYSHLLKVHPNFILPSTPGSPQRSLPLGFPHQHPVHSSPFPHISTVLYCADLLRFVDLYEIPWLSQWELKPRYSRSNSTKSPTSGVR